MRDRTSTPTLFPRQGSNMHNRRWESSRTLTKTSTTTIKLPRCRQVSLFLGSWETIRWSSMQTSLEQNRTNTKMFQPTIPGVTSNRSIKFCVALWKIETNREKIAKRRDHYRKIGFQARTLTITWEGWVRWVQWATKRRCMKICFTRWCSQRILRIRHIGLGLIRTSWKTRIRTE